jgi:hypothetical protein
MNGTGFSNYSVMFKHVPFYHENPVCKKMNDMSGTGW